MKRLLVLLAFAFAAACAHQPRPPSDVFALRVKDMDRQMKELDKEAGALSRACLGRAIHAELLLAPDAPERERRDLAFKNYYESFLDAKGQGEYVDCLRKRWALPWLHAEYRRGRRWLATARQEERDNEPLAGPDKKIADATEAFEKKDDGTSLRRVTITFASGAKTTLEETVAAASDVKQASSGLPALKALDDQVNSAVKAVDAIDQPTDETPAQ